MGAIGEGHRTEAWAVAARVVVGQSDAPDRKWVNLTPGVTDEATAAVGADENWIFAIGHSWFSRKYGGSAMNSSAVMFFFIALQRLHAQVRL